MNNTIGNLLLVLGTVFGGIAAANSARPWRWVEVPAVGGLAGEFLYGELPEGVEVLESGSDLELTDEVVARFRQLGLERVRVRNPPRASVALGAGDVFAGNLLAESVDPQGETTMAEAGTFIDEALEARLRAAGVDSVIVVVTRAWIWAAWDWMGVFVGAVVAMALGVMLKRAGPALPDEGAESSAPGVRSLAGHGELLRGMDRQVADLAARCGELDVEALHAEVDEILRKGCYEFVEGRAILQAAGTEAYTTVMSPFSSGERRLNRAWSAAVDGYADEARDSIRQAARLLHAAAEVYPG